MSFDELVCFLFEFNAAMLLRKVSYSDGIRWVQLPLEKRTARIYYVCYLEHTTTIYVISHSSTPYYWCWYYKSNFEGSDSAGAQLYIVGSILTWGNEIYRHAHTLSLENSAELGNRSMLLETKCLNTKFPGSHSRCYAGYSVKPI